MELNTVENTNPIRQLPAQHLHWLRWYHGTVNDPKWRLIAQETHQTVATVVAIWAALLENASDSNKRGTLSHWSNELTALVLGLPTETVELVFQRMKHHGLFHAKTDTISAWEKRNPKREREDYSTERVQQFRERKRHETPRNTTKRPEESRIEENTESTFPLPVDPPVNIHNSKIKHLPFGQFGNVKLTEIEQQKLITKFGNDSALERIEALSEYLSSTGKKYRSHYATILSWDRRNGGHVNGQRPTYKSKADRTRENCDSLMADILAEDHRKRR